MMEGSHKGIRVL